MVNKVVVKVYGKLEDIRRFLFTLTRNSYVYVTEAEPIYPPTDNQPVHGAKLSRGMFLVSLNPPKT